MYKARQNTFYKGDKEREKKIKGKHEPRLCCGQRGSMRADIKVQRMDRDDRGKVWKPYETTGREKGREI